MIGVVHLVWGPLGPTPLTRFIDSYRAHPAGIDHELIIAWNGTTRADRDRLSPALAGAGHADVVVPVPRRDLAVYRQLARQLPHDTLCFLNSHATVAADGWLEKLAAPLAEDRRALAGATGSWMSPRTDTLQSLGWPTVYREHLPPREQVLAARRQLDAELARESASGTEATAQDAAADARFRRDLAGRLRVLAAMPEQLLRFPAFPAAHIRTNAFIIDRRLLAELTLGPLTRKLDAWLAESGRHSLTNQVLARGGRALVVDREGQAFPGPRWPQSRTFWQGDQEGLLIADNQTRIYRQGDPARRRMLSALAWGPAAAPSLAGVPSPAGAPSTSGIDRSPS